MALLATALFISASCAHDAKLQPVDELDSKLIDAIADKTVMLTNDYVCAGVWVSEHEILTANHCVATTKWCTSDRGKTVHECSKTPTTDTPVFYFRTRGEFDGEEYDYSVPATVALLIRQNTRSDLALLWTARTAPSVAAIADEEAIPGTQVHVVGHPDTRPYIHVSVVVKRNAWEDTNQNGSMHMRRLTVLGYMAAGGTSGGGAWDSAGRLVGICLSRSRWSIINESYFASTQEIRAFRGMLGAMSPHNG